MTTPPPLDGLVPDALAPRSHRIFLDDLDVPVGPTADWGYLRLRKAEYTDTAV